MSMRHGVLETGLLYSIESSISLARYSTHSLLYRVIVLLEEKLQASATLPLSDIVAM